MVVYWVDSGEQMIKRSFIPDTSMHPQARIGHPQVWRKYGVPFRHSNLSFEYSNEVRQNDTGRAGRNINTSVKLSLLHNCSECIAICQPWGSLINEPSLTWVIIRTLSPPQVVVEPNGRRRTSMSFDWVTENLYWTELTGDHQVMGHTVQLPSTLQSFTITRLCWFGDCFTRRRKPQYTTCLGLTGWQL